MTRRFAECHFSVAKLASKSKLCRFWSFESSEHSSCEKAGCFRVFFEVVRFVPLVTAQQRNVGGTYVMMCFMSVTGLS